MEQCLTKLCDYLAILDLFLDNDIFKDFFVVHSELLEEHFLLDAEQKIKFIPTEIDN